MLFSHAPLKLKNQKRVGIFLTFSYISCIAEAYLESSRTSTMKFLAVNFFPKKAPS